MPMGNFVMRVSLLRLSLSTVYARSAKLSAEGSRLCRAIAYLRAAKRDLLFLAVSGGRPVAGPNFTAEKVGAKPCFGGKTRSPLACVRSEIHAQ